MANTRQTGGIEPIHLNFQSVRQVVVIAEDGRDRWVTTVEEAAQACRSALDQQEWQKEFEAFLGRIHEWAKEHNEVSAAFVGINSEGLTGVIITKGTEYRYDFDDEITTLDIELAEKFPNCRADILQSPEGEPESRIPFIAVERAVQVYGNKI